MSAEETAAPTAKVEKVSKLPVILSAGALFFSLISVALLVVLLLKPVTGKIEESKLELKESVESTQKGLQKSIDGLRDACIDWQTVLKTATDNPDATFKIIKTEDGLLSLSEIKATPAEPKP